MATHSTLRQPFSISDADELEADQTARVGKSQGPDLAVSFPTVWRRKRNRNTEGTAARTPGIPRKFRSRSSLASVGMEAGQNKPELPVAAIKAEYSKFPLGTPPRWPRAAGEQAADRFREWSANP